MSDLKNAIRQIQAARGYTEDLLNHVEGHDWFRFPAGGVSHVAWQAGHLAICEYGLALKRVRGVKPDDAQHVPADYAKLFGKGSVPVDDPDQYPSIADLRFQMRHIHDLTIAELSAMEESVVLESTSEPPHPMFNTKLGALHWCAQHEFLHAGQIGLLRRQLGAESLR